MDSYKNALDYFDSLTGGWINYSHNYTLVKLFSHALIASETGHQNALKCLKEEIQKNEVTHAITTMTQTLSLFDGLMASVPSTEGVKYAGSKLKPIPYILELAKRVPAHSILDGFPGTTVFLKHLQNQDILFFVMT